MTSMPESFDEQSTGDQPDAVAAAPVQAPGEVSVDERLLAAHDLALAALREITSEASIGEPAGYIAEDDGAVSLRFHTLLAGYPGWFWTVSLARVEGAEPTVLEVELMPGDGALLAPEWVPWAVRLAEYQAAQAALAEAAEAVGEDADETELDADDADDFDDDDEADDLDESSLLHAGDVDGVDIDELDDSGDDDADDFGDDSDEESSDEDDFDEDDFDDSEDDEVAGGRDER